MYWNQYDVYSALIGGMLMGIATTIHLLFKGRLTGFSGTLFSIFTFEKSSFFWKSALMISLIIISTICFKIFGYSKPILFSKANPPFDTPELMFANLGIIGFAIGGFLVGFGTKLSNGCTSGHGVCGLPRLSPRSIVAVITFMSSGFLTSSLKQFINVKDFIFDQNVFYKHSDLISSIVLITSIILVILLVLGQFIINRQQFSDVFIGIIVGSIFGFALVLSGMVKRSKINSFLTINANRDPTLAFVMASAVSFNLISFNLILKKMEQPILADKFEIPKLKTIDKKLIIGAFLFGMGWGISDLCPGPAITLYPMFSIEISIIFVFYLAIGQISAEKVDKYLQRNKETPLQEK